MMKEKDKTKMPSLKVGFEGRQFDISLRDDADQSVVAEIFKWREYKAVEKVICNLVSPVLDVGAHIGVFSLYIRALNPLVKIYALEPEEDNFDLLRKNISKNDLHDIKLCRLALAGETGQRGLMIAPDNINHRLAIGSGDIAPSDQVKQVAAISLSDFIYRNDIDSVGLLKLDIESGEYEIFEKLHSEDFSRIQNVVLEYHDYFGHSHKEIENILRTQGFGVQIFPSRFEKDLGFILARNKRIERGNAG